jgi:HEAT repeat protein
LAGRTSEVEVTVLGEEEINVEREMKVSENWREAIRLCVASCNDDDVNSVLRAILTPLEHENAQNTTRPRAVLAVLCLADGPNASEEVAQAVLQAFARQVSEDDSGYPIETEIDVAAMELATSRWAEKLRSLLVEPLLARLEDENIIVRQAATRLLGQIGDARIVEPLIARLEYEDSFVRRAAAEVLGQIGNPRAVEPLIDRLEDEDISVQRVAAEALGQIGNPQAVEPLINRLEDKDISIQRVATRALGQIGNPQAVEVLIGRLSAKTPEDMDPEDVDTKDTEDMEDGDVRSEALEALSLTCQDSTDRKLLSKYLDVIEPFLDPRQEIDEKRVKYAARKLTMSVDEVRRHYEALAQQFPLKLSWQASCNK